MDYGENTKITKKLIVHGIVQGVGFRPLVYHIATKYSVSGYVKNMGGVVEIVVQTTQANYALFLAELREKKGAWEIRDIIEEDVSEDMVYASFKIVESSGSNLISILPPDLSLCKDCEDELLKDTDRRYRNPFISCTACGPRYTITKTFPYDRCNTSMSDFPMCDCCEDEYTTTKDRRFHAQTISCHDCGPYLIWHPGELTKEAALNEAIHQIKEGQIIAVKGIGGYHFVCSPFLERTVKNLRLLKEREEKPFAVMFPNMDTIKEYCDVSKEEEELLISTAKPIVLLREKGQHFAASTNKGSKYCGAFLPYTPIQLLLTKECGPLIMTSANISHQPIIKDDETILALESEYLGGVLYHKREILRSVDDSVAMIVNQKPLYTRRSRGYVPYPVFLNRQDTILIDKKAKDKKISNNTSKDSQTHFIDSTDILAFGGDLKATFTLYKNGAAIVSEYFGDLEENAVMEQYQKAIKDLSNLFQINPKLLVCDLHPNYHSVQLAKSYNLPLMQVQHHQAHIASVMAEHNLTQKLIGIAFDGTGYGIDGAIWGGEFFIWEPEINQNIYNEENPNIYNKENPNKDNGSNPNMYNGNNSNIYSGNNPNKDSCELQEKQKLISLEDKNSHLISLDGKLNGQFKRAAHLAYAPLIGGDSSMKDGKKSSTCLLHHYGLDSFIDDKRAPLICSALDHNINTIQTSSMGRLFDAVSSILDICHYNQYEGEGAILLEQAALEAIDMAEPVPKLEFSYYENDNTINIDPKPMLESLCKLKGTINSSLLSLSFHYAISEMIVTLCKHLREREKTNVVAISGGVFQNRILLEETIHRLSKNGFQVYWNTIVPPNDGGISLGQTYLGLLKSR